MRSCCSWRCSRRWLSKTRSWRDDPDLAGDYSRRKLDGGIRVEMTEICRDDVISSRWLVYRDEIPGTCSWKANSWLACR